ncbi:MAG: hypothetical protein H0Z24_03580 [Thermosipho sp. (in: Bacteria)]|nr:hypothetical protein [Thermosipho sp. (in: thermotogales)]
MHDLKEYLLNKEYLTPQELVYLSLGCPELKDKKATYVETDESCVMCGQPIMGKGLKKTKTWPFSANFTNIDLWAKPHSEHVCIPCAYAQIGKAPNGQALKGRTFVATTDEFKILTDNESISETILNPPEPPFVINVGLYKKAFQKHLILRSKVNYSTQNGIIVQYGEETVILTPDLLEIYKQIISLRKAGLGWGEIKYDTPNNNKKKAEILGEKETHIFNERIKPYLDTLALEFLLITAPKGDKK